MTGAGESRVEVVRGRVEGSLAEEIRALWTGVGLTEAEAEERLPQSVCVLRSEAGGLAGVGSVFIRDLLMVGGRRFWSYRAGFLEGVDDPTFFAMLGACFDALAAEFAAAGEGPVGVALLVSDTALLERNPLAIWPETGFLHAGFAPDGRQLRIRYFEGARI